MSYSKVTIIFNSVPDVNQVLKLKESKLNININEIFKETRYGSGQVVLPVYVPGNHQGDEIQEPYYKGAISLNYKNAFNLDYNSTNLFTVSYVRNDDDLGSGSVTIIANYGGAVFSLVENTTFGVNVIIENNADIPEIKINSIVFTPSSSNQCQNVKVNVTTDLLATKIISPISVNSNNNNPFSFDWLRGQLINIIVEDSNGKQDSKLLQLPSLLNSSDFTVNVNSSPNGATVIIENVNTNSLNLEYSLDNSTWQNSNTFSGLEEGNFTLYVRDQFGCTFSKSFSVNEFGIHSPFFYISKSNSIRFAKRITWGVSESYKTDENTLSCEVDVDLPYKEVQQFQSADVITTQFKSNYSNNVAKIIKNDLSEINLQIEKKTSNIGIKDKRDARKYNVGNGKTGVYFISGNTYNYDTNVVTGTYSLIGDLPEWAVVGNYIVISNAWFLIEEIVFDESKNADVIIFSQNYTGQEISIVTGSIFNRFNYEVYEFSIDMVDYIDQHFRVKLVNIDLNFTTITHLSEEIWCKVKHDGVLEIKYYNTTNTDIFYATGIQFKLRIPLTIQKGIPEEESEIHKTDNDAILLSADLYEVDQFIFEPVTKEIWRKIMIALSHEKVWLNGTGYVKNGSFSSEGPLEQSNLYVLTANMIKTGNVYNSQGSANFNDFDGSQVEVPGLISTESGYVRY